MDDFSEYGEKSLDHLIEVTQAKIKKLRQQLDDECYLLVYAMAEREARKCS